MLARAPEHVQSMDKVRSEARVCIMQTCLHQMTLRTCVVRRSLRENGVKLEVFRDPSFDYVSGESGFRGHWERLSRYYPKLKREILDLFLEN